MVIKYILITSIISIGGQPDINYAEFSITNSDKECIELSGEIQSLAHSEGKKIYTWCVPAQYSTDIRK
ncbi:hypothetical protein DYG67_05365 [Yersinia enterocolitica]|nr:hypothetical protein [Yersinia enterocolitica]